MSPQSQECVPTIGCLQGGGPRQVYVSQVVLPGYSTDDTATRPQAQPTPLMRGRCSDGSAVTRVDSHWHAVSASACRVGGRAARKNCNKAINPGSWARCVLRTGGGAGGHVLRKGTGVQRWIRRRSFW